MESCCCLIETSSPSCDPVPAIFQTKIRPERSTLERTLLTIIVTSHCKSLALNIVRKRRDVTYNNIYVNLKSTSGREKKEIYLPLVCATRSKYSTCEKFNCHFRRPTGKLQVFMSNGRKEIDFTVRRVFLSPSLSLSRFLSSFFLSPSCALPVSVKWNERWAAQSAIYIGSLPWRRPIPPPPRVWY